MSFPVTTRYFLNFRNSDTGLTPTFLYFKNASTFANIAPPSIIESPAGGGTYYFDWTWTTAADADITFEVDGGVSIPTEEVRYIKGSLSPRDRFNDEPISQVKDDVWNELITGHQTANSMGRVLNDVFRVLKNKAIINAVSKQLEVYDDAGVAIVFTFDLKDENGVASATRIFRRLPL